MASAEGGAVDKVQRGREKRAQLFGPQVAPGGKGTQRLAPYYGQWVLENVFGDLWTRPTLGDKTRVLVTLVALAATRSFPQMKGYVSVALNVGWTREEVVEAIVQLAPYVGVPTVHNALDVVDEVFSAA